MTPEFVTLCRQWFFEHGRWSFVAPLIGHSTERYPMLNQLFHPSGTNEARRILATYLPSDRGHFNGDWKCMTEGEQSAWRTFCVKYIAPELMVRARFLPSIINIISIIISHIQSPHHIGLDHSDRSGSRMLASHLSRDSSPGLRLEGAQRRSRRPLGLLRLLDDDCCRVAVAVVHVAHRAARRLVDLRHFDALRRLRVARRPDAAGRAAVPLAAMGVAATVRARDTGSQPRWTLARSPSVRAALRRSTQ